LKTLHQVEESKNKTNELPSYKQDLFEGLHTPLKGDQESINITQTIEKKHDYRFGSGNKDFENIKMVDLDQVEESKIDRYYEHSSNKNERGSTIKNILHMYEKDLNSFIEDKQMNNSREMSKESSFLSSDKKRSNEMNQKLKRELESTKQR